MERERLLQSNIIKDLNIIAKAQISAKSDWRLAYIWPCVALALFLPIYFSNLTIIWIASIVLFGVAAYHVVRYIPERNDYVQKRNALVNAMNRADISVSVERLSHIAEETIYEPHRHGVGSRSHTDLTKRIKCFYFEGGKRWRVPVVNEHYAWSREFHLSTSGLDNISVQGNEFYFISLQGFPDIAYVYPCKYFVFEDNKK